MIAGIVVLVVIVFTAIVMLGGKSEPAPTFTPEAIPQTESQLPPAGNDQPAASQQNGENVSGQTADTAGEVTAKTTIDEDLNNIDGQLNSLDSDAKNVGAAVDESQSGK